MFTPADSGNGKRGGLAASEPPQRGGAEARASSVRRRIDEVGMGASPRAKRSGTYVPPMPSAATAMDAQQLSNEVVFIKNAVDSMHA